MADELRFDWDEANISHIHRHQVTLEEAEQALRNDPFDLHYDTIEGEERWTVIGHADNLRVLLVVWTLRGEDVVRVVTARQASKTASLTYMREKGLGL